MVVLLSGYEVGRDRELSDVSLGGDAPDLVPPVFHEPHIAIRPRNDRFGPTARGRDREPPSNHSGSGHPPNLVWLVLNEPEIAIQPCSNPDEIASRLHWELRNLTLRGNAPNLIAFVLIKPEVAIRP